MTINHSVLEAIVEWDDDTNDWETGNVLRDSVQWTRGGVLLERVTVALDAALSRGALQCRMGLFGINTNPMVLRLDGAPPAGVVGGNKQLDYMPVPCVHRLSVEDVECVVHVRRGSKPGTAVSAVMGFPAYQMVYNQTPGATKTVTILWRTLGQTPDATNSGQTVVTYRWGSTLRAAPTATLDTTGAFPGGSVSNGAIEDIANAGRAARYYQHKITLRSDGVSIEAVVGIFED